MKKMICFLMAFCWLLKISAFEQRDLYGAWTRTFSTCERVTPAMIEKLRQGWSDDNWRKMMITIDENTFRIVSFDSAKCELTGDCQAIGINKGILKIDGRRINMLSTFNETDNPWGKIYKIWEYEIIDDVLVMKTLGACGDRKASIVLIRAALM